MARRRSSHRRTRARHVYHHHRHEGRRQNGFERFVDKTLTPLSFLASFVPQVSNKDTVGNATYQGLDNTDKAKFLTNSVVSRVTGFNPYPQWGVHTQTVNPAGMVNKYTGMGIGLMILKEVMPRGMGGKKYVGKMAKGLLWGGLAGGFFDDPKTPARQGGGTAAQRAGPDMQFKGFNTP